MSQNHSTIAVQVQPNARRNEVLGIEDGVLHLRIAAPPVKGKANKELIAFLSQLLGVSKGSVMIEKGLTSRRKVVAIEGLDRAKILERLGVESPK